MKFYRNLAILLLSFSFTGCVTSREMKRQIYMAYLIGWQENDSDCRKYIIDYNKFLFGPRIGRTKREVFKMLTEEQIEEDLKNGKK